VNPRVRKQDAKIRRACATVAHRCFHAMLHLSYNRTGQITTWTLCIREIHFIEVGA